MRERREYIHVGSRATSLLRSVSQTFLRRPRLNIQAISVEQTKTWQVTDEDPCDVKAGCRKSNDFEGSGRMDAACGESRHGCRVSPCPLKSLLFREATGHPVSHKGLHRLPSSICLQGNDLRAKGYSKWGLKLRVTPRVRRSRRVALTTMAGPVCQSKWKEPVMPPASAPRP